MRTVFEYKNVEDTAITLPVYDFKTNKWLDSEIVLRRTLLGAMHPGVKLVVGQVPTPSELGNKKDQINSYITKIKSGIEMDGLGTYKLVFASGSRTHGHGFFGDREENVAEIYFGKDNTMGFVNYGSILVTELRKIISSSNLKVLIVDDEDPEMRAAGLGDSHGKCSSEVLRMMSENVPRQSPEGEKNTPLQVRIGFPGKFLFKGTIVSFSNDITPPSIVKKYGGDWDLILPTSGIKGNKPAVGTKIVDKTIYLGNVHFAENRDAVASQQFWMWYTAKAIKKDLIPGLEQAASELRDAVVNRTKIADVFDIANTRLDVGFTGDVDPDNWEATDDDDSPVSDKGWEDPIMDIVGVDEEGILINHPKIVNTLRTRLARRWRRYALNTHIAFQSFMMMPDDSLAKRTIVCHDIPAGLCILFRNPILHYGSIQFFHNIHEGHPHQMKQRGTVWISHEDAANIQGDFDGDFVSVLPLTKEQQAFAEEQLDNASDPGFADEMYQEYIKGELTFPEDNLNHIIFETAFQEYIWGDTPTVYKPKKSAIKGDIENVFYNAMDSMTGIISNLIQIGTTNGSINKEIELPVHSLTDDVYSGETYKTTMIEFLANQMQIAVDRLKNNIFHNTKGIQLCRNYIEQFKKPSWIHEGMYKSPHSYKTNVIPIGTMKKEGKSWVDESTGVMPTDSISLTIGIVNYYWTKWEADIRPLGHYRKFMIPPKDRKLLENAALTHQFYGKSMSEALNMDGQGEAYTDAKRKRIAIISETIDDKRKTREAMEIRLNEEIEKRGNTEFLALIWNEPDGEVAREVFANINNNGESGVVDENHFYRVATKEDYAAALWSKCHTSTADKRSIGSTVFKMYPDVIMDVLKKKEKNLNTTIWFSGDKFKTGDYIFADRETQSQGDSTGNRPRRAVKKDDKDPNVFMPSRINNKAQLLDVNSNEGIAVPNSVELLVRENGVNQDREKSIRYEIHIRSSSKKEWKVLGYIGTGRPVPELDKIHKAKLYSYRLTDKLQAMMQPQNEGLLGYRTKGGTIIWE